MRQANALVHLQVFVRGVRAVALSRVFIPQAGQLITAVNAVTVTGF
jgi:hypothetical protein